jgi:hypothetical protein
MYKYIEVNPGASASTPAKSISVSEAISTENTSTVIPISGKGKVLPFRHSFASQGQTLEEEAWDAYQQVKPQFYTVCQMLADS